MAGIVTVSYFLISLLFNLVAMTLWFRVFLRFYRVSPLHPFAKMIYQLTNPLLKPFERFAYTDNRPPRFDWLCLIFLILLEIIKFIVLVWLFYNRMLPLYLLSLFVLGDLIIQPINLLFYALLARIILSWMNPQWQQHPVKDILQLLTNPLIRLGHKIIPDISGFDFAPFIMMVILKLITLFISASMPLSLL